VHAQQSSAAQAIFILRLRGEMRGGIECVTVIKDGPPFEILAAHQFGHHFLAITARGPDPAAKP
jgi:hypothetical protein